MLDIRLATLDPVVARFVLVASSVNHQGRPQPNPLPDWDLKVQERLAPWRDKLRVVQCHSWNCPRFDLVADPFAVERWQRDQIVRGLALASDDDLVLISDVDEIPRPELLSQLAASPITCQQPVSLCTTLYYYKLDWRVPYPVYHWPVLTTASRARDIGPQNCRTQGGGFFKIGADIPEHGLFNEAGWHFSWLGDAGHLRRKARSVSESFVATERTMAPGFFEECIATGRDFLGRFQCEPVDIDNTWPKPIVDNPDRYRHLTRGGTHGTS